MGCDLTIVTVGITGKKTIGKRTEPRGAFYFAEEFASQHLVTLQPEQKPEMLQFLVREDGDPSGDALPAG